MKRGWVWLLAICAGGLLVSPRVARGWGNAGHEAVVAVALQFDPSLRPRVEAILTNLPASQKWKDLRATGLIPHNLYQTEKKDPDAWVKALASDAEKAATFPDWARDYEGYRRQEYAKWHFMDLDYDNPEDQRFVERPNSLTMLPVLEAELKTADAGERAWALAWVMHLVGDMHQPLHDATRSLPNDETKSDHGGNDVAYENMKLHAFWDHLPDHSAQNNPPAYAAGLLASLKKMKKSARAEFEKKSSDLDPEHWVAEGHDLICTIGYPSDQKVANYDAAAHRIADAQVLLAGVRLAKLLERDLP